MAHRLERDRVALANHQGRQIAVQVVEIGQGQEGLPAERLEATAGVDGVVVEQAAAHAVGQARGPALGGRVLAVAPLAAHQGKVVGSGEQGARQARRVGGVVLAVAIQHHHDRRPRGAHARADRPALAGVALVTDQAEVGDLIHQGAQTLGRGVPAGVVHEQDLAPPAREGDVDLPRQGRNRALLVEDGRQDRDFRRRRGGGSGGHGPP